VGLTDAGGLKAHLGKDRAKPMVKTDRDGLGSRVSPKGKITFQVRYYYQGSEEAKRVDLASYPSMSLVEARQETLRLRGLLEKGHDPAVVPRTEEQVIVTAETFEGLFRKWHESVCKKKKKGHREILRTFDLRISDPWQYPRSRNQPANVARLAEALAEDIPGIADRILRASDDFSVARRTWQLEREYASLTRQVAHAHPAVVSFDSLFDDG
jgi:hypothetical protein